MFLNNDFYDLIWLLIIITLYLCGLDFYRLLFITMIFVFVEYRYHKYLNNMRYFVVE